MPEKRRAKYHFYPHDVDRVISVLGRDGLIECLQRMYLIRHFETRAEAAYQQGKIGGFFHSYVGQEAVQTAAVAMMGKKQWWSTSYRCHALALLLDATPEELMAELYGRATGNALGRGGSMHFFTERLLGGGGIVGGQIPLATGAAFSIKYRQVVPDSLGPQAEVSVCFLGDGAVVQGAFHESLNLSSLWNLPCIYVIENNQWGMGTGVTRAVCVEPIAEKKAPGYGMESITLDGADFFSCAAGFYYAYEQVKKTSRPMLIEVVVDRFKGHSISDPGLYRTREQLQSCMENDPIMIMTRVLESRKMADAAMVAQMDKQAKDQVLAAMDFADKSPWPDPIHLEEDVLAP